MDVWRLISTGLMLVAGVGWLAFCGLYAFTRWWTTREGRHLMLTRGGLALIVVAWALYRLWGPFPQWVWVPVILPTTWSAWQGVALLWRRQHEVRKGSR